jgi:ribonuclease H / adenosylcobalamin/alpha-ribazole phosphatase
LSGQTSLFELDEDAVLHFDGGSRGNPGPAAYGFVLDRPNGEQLAAAGEAIGVATNNVAEYRGLIEGMRRASELGVSRLTVHGDSKLVIEQMKGAWRVRAEGLRPLHDEARAVARSFESVRFEHVRRGGNAEADRLVNVALDEQEGRTAT